jgi:3-isopropylmalate/(R)-2-methylmalate dehydratase small subunit
MADSKINRVQGRAVPVIGDAIDTDRIIPARYLKEITFTNMGNYPFFDERFDSEGRQKPHPFNEQRYQGANLLFVNGNFGCGSSREHAPQSLTRWGIKGIVGESFAEIFAGNCVMLGIPAVVTSPENIVQLQKLAADRADIEWTLDISAMTISGGGFSCPVTMPEPRRNALVNGTWDSTALLLANAAKVRETAQRLPYTQNFAA